MLGRRLLSPIAVGLMSLLSACAGGPKIDPDVDAYGMPNAELALQRSIGRVDAAMLDLGGMSVAGRISTPPGPVVVAAELQRPLTFAWAGPIDTGVKALADRIGYRLIVTGPQNALPVIVSVNMTDASALDLFKAIGNSAGTQATVIVDPEHHQVQVQHHV
jgi:defect-in-organelle-trafficking protein DotD